MTAMPILVLLFIALVIYMLIMPAVASSRANEALNQLQALRQEMQRLRLLVVTNAAPAPKPETDPESEVITSTWEKPNPAHEASAPSLPARRAPLPEKPASLTVKPAPQPAPMPPPPPVAATEKPLVKTTEPTFSLEQFMGVKLFAWVGGLALFIGIVLFVKYAFEHDLIPAGARVAIGFATGLGLTIAGLLLRNNKRYAELSHTLCATGVLTLYGVSYAGQTLYGLYGQSVTFGLMATITAGAFLLAVRMHAQVVAVLGMLGGFLAPLLLFNGRDEPLALFTCIALLDAGMLAVVRRTSWDHLTPLAAGGTGLWILFWLGEFFGSSGYAHGTATYIPAAVLLFFPLLFGAAGWFKKQSAPVILASAGGLSFMALLLCLAAVAVPSIAGRPWLLFGFVFVQHLLTAACAWRESKLFPLTTAAGSTVFLLLAAWSLTSLTPALLPQALVLYIIFGVIQAALPVLWHRLRKDGETLPEAALWMPLLVMTLLMLGIMRVPEASTGIWITVLMMNISMLSLGAAARKAWPVLASFGLTMLTILIWLISVLNRADLRAVSAGEFLTVLPLFAVLMTGGGLWLRKRLLPEPNENDSEFTTWLPAAMTFPLLILACMKLPSVPFTAFSAVTLGLAALLLFVAARVKQWILFPISLAAAYAVEAVLFFKTGQSVAEETQLLWHLATWGLFLAWPFCMSRHTRSHALPWITAVLAGVLEFLFIYPLTRKLWPDLAPGLIPALCSIPILIGLLLVYRDRQTAPAVRLSQLAWFGGVALLFLTSVIPIQWERQWLTLGWALEGAALCWLFRRVPHEGLRLTGVALLFTAFVRLVLNQRVLVFADTGMPLWNWQLYTYGIAIAAHVAAVRFLAPPRDRIEDFPVRSVIQGQAGVLLFVLLNLEIADFFTPTGSAYVSVQFAGEFAQAMTVTIAWSLYALALISWGLWKRSREARWAGVGLMGISLLKLFIFDLAGIGSLYRIAVMIIVALIALAVSFLYQRFAVRIMQEPES